MKPNFKAAFIIATISLMFAGCCTTQRVTRWEYKTVTNLSDTELNQLAEQGWRVESFSTSASPVGNERADWVLRNSYLLKRLKQ